jgi:transcriptional regulator with XRE-family HTH domain/tetratricopeptide (TPR) repeat protein
VTPASARQHPLRSEREARHWSIDDLAERTKLSPKTILRAEQGRGLNPETRRILCSCLGRAADELGLVPRGRVGGSGVVLAECGVEPGFGRLVPFRTTEARVLDAARLHYEHMYRQVGGITTGAKVGAFLRSHVPGPSRGHSVAAGKEIYRALGGVIAIAGVCAYDGDSQELSKSYLQRALMLAQASDDRAFGAYVCGLVANQLIFLGMYERAVVVTDAAIQTVGPSLSNALRADLHALQAKAYARTNDRERARRSMHLAEVAEEAIDQAMEPPETNYIQPGLINEELADALLSMGDTRAALSYAERFTGTSTHPRGRANRLVILTNIEMARGEFDRAAETTRVLLEATQGMESRRFRDRFLCIRNVISQHRSAASVRAVSEELDARLALPF